MANNNNKPAFDKPALAGTRRSSKDDFTGFLYVRIPRTEERLEADAKKKYTVYEIRIENNTEEWSVFRRFSEFDKLHTTLSNRFPGQTPDFPTVSKFLGGFVDQVEKRRGALEKYLNELLVNPVFMFQCNDLQQFLSVPTAVAKAGKGDAKDQQQ